MLKPLIDQCAPGLMDVYGIGYDVATKLLIAPGDRLTSERAFAHMCGVAPLPASSGKTQALRRPRSLPTPPHRDRLNPPDVVSDP